MQTFQVTWILWEEPQKHLELNWKKILIIPIFLKQFQNFGVDGTLLWGRGLKITYIILYPILPG